MKKLLVAFLALMITGVIIPVNFSFLPAIAGGVIFLIAARLKPAHLLRFITFRINAIPHISFGEAKCTLL